MGKYIIKNCPAYCYLGKECHSREGKYGASCCEVTDCVLKQIVELCKEDYTSENNVFDISKKLFAQRILDKLDIQEVE